MATVATLNIRLTANATELNAALGVAQNRGQMMAGGIANAMTRANQVAVGFIQDSLRVGGAFQESMNQVAAVSRDSLAQYDAAVGQSGAGLQALTDIAEEMGIKTQFSATQAADGLNFLALAGFDVNQQLVALPEVLSLAAAGQMDLGRASDIATDTLTGFGLEVEDLPRLVDVMTATFTKSNTDLNQLGRAMTYVGPIASQLGVSVEETSAALGLLANAGFKSTMGGTALRGSLSRLINPTDQAGDILKAMGVSAMDANGNFVGLTDVVRQFENAGAGNVELLRDITKNFGDVSKMSRTTQDALLDMNLATGKVGESTFQLNEGITSAEQLIGAMGSQSQYVANLMTIFGQRAGPGMAVLIGQGSDALVNLTSELEASGGTAQAVANTQMQGLNGALKELKSAWEGLQIAVFQGNIGGVIEEQVDRLAAFVRNLAGNEELIRSVIGNLSRAVEIGADVFMALLNTGERLMNWFTKIPEPMQTTTVVVTALAMAIGPTVLQVASLVATIATVGPAVTATTAATTGATAAFGGIGTAATAGAGGLGVLKGALAVLTGPVGWAIGAATLLTGAWMTDFMGFRTWVQGWWPELVDWGVNAGKWLIEGIGRGIKTAFNFAFGPMIDLAQGIKDIMQNAFDFGSPSKVMTQFGLWLPQGLAVGQRKGIPAVEAATRDMTRAAMPEMGVSSGPRPDSRNSIANNTTSNNNYTINVNGANQTNDQLADTIMKRIAATQRRAAKAGI
ncbi:MAG: phage tail tape measure protein [Deinococcota bacterium]